MWPEVIYKLIKERNRIDEKIREAQTVDEKQQLENEWFIIHKQLSTELTMLMHDIC